MKTSSFRLKLQKQIKAVFSFLWWIVATCIRWVWGGTRAVFRVMIRMINGIIRAIRRGAIRAYRWMGRRMRRRRRTSILKKGESADTPILELKQKGVRGRVRARLRAIKAGYSNPSNLRKRLALSYAQVTSGIFMLFWLMIIVTSANDFEEMVEIALISFVPTLFVFGVFGLMLGTLFGFVASREPVQRLQVLDSAATAWSNGEFDVQVQDDTSDEIGQLGRKLNGMAQHLDQLISDQVDLAAVEERTHLARELHDAVKQQLFASSMQISSARSVIHQSPEHADRILGDVENLVDEMQKELMVLIHTLRPSSLQDEGLALALQKHVDTWSEQMEISAEIITNYRYPLSIATEQALFRVCQESLTNIAKHANATAISVQLDQKKQHTILQIRDNGQGFDLEKRYSGFGLQSMRERLEKINGMLEIESNPINGTIVTALLNEGEITI